MSIAWTIKILNYGILSKAFNRLKINVYVIVGGAKNAWRIIIVLWRRRWLISVESFPRDAAVSFQRARRAHAELILTIFWTMRIIAKWKFRLLSWFWWAVWWAVWVMMVRVWWGTALLSRHAPAASRHLTVFGVPLLWVINHWDEINSKNMWKSIKWKNIT